MPVERKGKNMSKIQLTDSVLDVMVKMSEGNPGAVNALSVMLKEGKTIDPQGFMGGLGVILLLDTWGIYGSSIYVLYNDKCDRDIRKMLLLMRAGQLGLFPVTKIKKMAHDQAYKINLTDEEWKDIDDKVCAQLVEFQKAA